MKHIVCQQIIRLRLLITAAYTLLALSGYTQSGNTAGNVNPSPDSLAKPDTVAQKLNVLEPGFDLDAPVMYFAKDSSASSPDQKKMFLYGEAIVKYQGQTMMADYIEIDMAKNEVFARGKVDSTGKMIKKVNFKDGESELNASEVRYNLKSKKGMVKDVLTTEGEGYIHMEKAKKQPDNEVHLRNGKYTTCDRENPHYHFRLSRAIVIPDDKIVTGPMYMVVGKIPTPLALPFGYFPNKKGKVKGLIIPQYGSSATYGYYLLNGGYYVPFGQRADAQFLGDIYSRGSWSLKEITRYKVRYRFAGSTNVSFSQYHQHRGFPDHIQHNEFFVRWNHNQDPKARPGSRLTANVNFGTQTNFTNNFNTYTTDYLSSSFQSNVSYTKTWLGTPFSLSTNLRHNQNRLAKTVTVTVPELTFNVTRFFPFKKEGVSIKRNRFREVYENIGVTMSSDLRNDVSAGDSLFALRNINSLLRDHSRNGMKHTASVGTTWKLPGDKFTLNPSVNMTERWYTQTLRKTYGGGSEVTTDTVRGFARNFEYAAVATLTTRLIGMYSTRRSNGPRLRHIFTPSLNFSFRPAYNSINKTIQSDSIGHTTQYSPYSLGVYGAPSPYKSGAIGLNLNNNLELKKRSSKDTVTGFVKIPIIENFQVSGSYDLARDTNRLSTIQFSARNTFFKVLNVVYSSSLDPYYYEKGSLTRYYYWQRGHGLGRITTNNLAVNYTFKAPPRKKKTAPKNLSQEDKEELESVKQNKGAYVDFDVPLNISAGYNLNFTRTYLGGVDTVLIKHTINVKGDVSITKKLKIGVDTYYDFIAGKVNYTTFDVYYDLHCWEFSATVIPFGLRKSYTLTLNVKASILQDLRLQRRRSWVDQ